MSVIRVFATLVGVVAAGLLAAPSALAYTSSPLGWCADLNPGGKPKVEAVSIPGRTSVAPDGTGRGAIGITLRTRDSGLTITVYGPDLRPVGYWSADFVGCTRTIVKFAELQGVGPRAGLPLKLRKGSIYYVGVSAASYLDHYPQGPDAISWLVGQVSSIRGAVLTY